MVSKDCITYSLYPYSAPDQFLFFFFFFSRFIHVEIPRTEGRKWFVFEQVTVNNPQVAMPSGSFRPPSIKKSKNKMVNVRRDNRSGGAWGFLRD
jgi:hypothetical protein